MSGDGAGRDGFIERSETLNAVVTAVKTTAIRVVLGVDEGTNSSFRVHELGTVTQSLVGEQLDIEWEGVTAFWGQSNRFGEGEPVSAESVRNLELVVNGSITGVGAASCSSTFGDTPARGFETLRFVERRTPRALGLPWCTQIIQIDEWKVGGITRVRFGLQTTLFLAKNLRKAHQLSIDRRINERL